MQRGRDSIKMRGERTIERAKLDPSKQEGQRQAEQIEYDVILIRRTWYFDTAIRLC